MAYGVERIERIRRGLSAAQMDAIVCALPMNVLLLSGYWPVVGTSLAIATADGRVVLLVHEDEQELAARGWASEVLTFKAGSLNKIGSAVESVREPLAAVACNLKLGRGCSLGYEDDEAYAPSSYAAMHIYGASLRPLLEEEFPSIEIVSASELLARQRSILTIDELARLRVACRIAGDAFTDGAWKLRAGLSETEAAAQFRAPLSTKGIGRDCVARADGFVFCMSGANSAQAYAAFARSRSKIIAPDEFALVHCNSFADGYWTDITRTFVIGEADERKREMSAAVFAARCAALEAISPGVKASDVDNAAREVLREHGFGDEFKHGLGHGVGFAAISHNALPRLHPASDDLLETGMVFNIEPAIYIEGYGGLRHCDMVVVRETGAEVLTPFLASIEELTIV